MLDTYVNKKCIRSRIPWTQKPWANGLKLPEKNAIWPNGNWQKLLAAHRNTLALSKTHQNPNPGNICRDCRCPTSACGCSAAGCPAGLVGELGEGNRPRVITIVASYACLYQKADHTAPPTGRNLRPARPPPSTKINIPRQPPSPTTSPVPKPMTTNPPTP